MSMPELFDGYVENPARVSSTCLVTVARNRYSVPCELAGQMLSTRLYPGKVVVVADDRLVASHERLSDRGQTRYDWQHYIPLIERKPGALRNGAPFADMPEPLQQLRRALLRDPGGDRVMAQVLSIVPTAGLDAVLVAVELALEGRHGVVSEQSTPQRHRPAERGTDAAERGHRAAGGRQAAGQRRALRQPAWSGQRRGGRPCVSLPLNSSNCACTAWPARGAT